MDGIKAQAFANAHSTHMVMMKRSYGESIWAMTVKKEHKRKRMQILKKDEDYR